MTTPTARGYPYLSSSFLVSVIGSRYRRPVEVVVQIRPALLLFSIPGDLTIYGVSQLKFKARVDGGTEASDPIDTGQEAGRL